MLSRLLYRMQGSPEYCVSYGKQLLVREKYIRYDGQTGAPTLKEVKMICNREGCPVPYVVYRWKQKVGGQ